MTKFITFTIAVFLIGTIFLLSSNAAEGKSQIEHVEVGFSNRAVGVESGQPIFTKDTKVWISNPTEKAIKLYLNKYEREVKSKELELSGLDAGTYTLMIVAEEDEAEKKVVGFTIQ
ncbi:MAG: hypothetical protein OXH57_10580 [Ekhidna sp.]|nr:hypothetical protein [Ekhidna sp.]